MAQVLRCDKDFIYFSAEEGDLNRNLAFCPGLIKEVSAQELNPNLWNWDLSPEDYYALVWEFIGLSVIVFGFLVVKKALL